MSNKRKQNNSHEKAPLLRGGSVGPRRSQRVKNQASHNYNDEDEDMALARKLQSSSANTSSSGYSTRSKRGQSALEKVIEQSDSEFPLLRRLDLYASDIKGDGNCLFRALGDQLYGDGGRSHVQIRAQIVGYMKEHSDYFEPFLGDETGETLAKYLRRMAQDAVYGDNLEIVGFANRYHANVVIYQSDNCYVISCNDDPATATEVHIAYHEWEHYSSIRNKDGPHEGLPHVRPRETPLAKQSGDSAKAPDWKVKVVQSSISYPVSPEIAREVLLKHNGDIGNSVEELLMREVEGDLPDSVEAQQQPSQSAQPAPPKRQKLTAREKKERQKMQALERKREKKKKLAAAAAPPAPHQKQNGSAVPVGDGIKTVYI